jgi:SAM-dependent methyltransferase
MSCGPIAWNYYLKKFNEIVSKYNPSSILKTDCNNEAFSRPIEGGLVKNLIGNCNVDLIEYDKKTIDRAKALFPQLNIMHGDIRNMNHIKDHSYDLVADFSTIDHISAGDIHLAINEYFRIIAPNGLLLLVCWFSYEQKHLRLNLDKWNPENQYFLWEDDIKAMFGSKLIIEEETIVTITYEGRDPWKACSPNDKPKYYLKYFLIQC